jgi:flavodoxin
MNALVIYDSTFGNTERLAQATADVLAERGSVRVLRVTKVQPADLDGVDLLILGCPTHKHRPTDAVQAFLDCLSKRSLNGIAAAAFDTRYRRSRLLTGSAARRVSKNLRKAGATIITGPESFFVAAREGPLETGEIERAAAWAREIVGHLQVPG